MSTIITPSEDQINIVITDDAVNVNITSEPVVVNVTEEIIQVSPISGAYPLPTTVYSVFGRTGAIIAQEGDYDLGELGDVTLVSKVNGDVLTYDGTKWINKAVSGTGTVTSVDMSVPTGLQVSGNPIVAAGTLAVSFANGYSIPTNTKQTNWDAAYNDKINSADVSGTTTKTLTLTQQDGGTITASWTDINTNLVTSVNTYIGDVVLTTTDIAEGLKLYYTEERVSANVDVAANTAARHAAVTIGTANGLSLSSQALSLALASASATGALSSTDWSTFNNKVPYTGATGDVNLGSNDITASAIIKAGGVDTQFLKADGSIDNNVYLTANDLPSTLTLYATTAASAVSGYTKLVTTIEDPDYNTTAVDVSTGEITIIDQFIAALVSPVNLINGNPGVFNVSTYGNIKKVSGSGQAEFYFKIYKRTSAGVETLVGTSSNTLPVVNSGYSEFFATAIWNDGIFGVTDTIVLKYYGSRISGGSNPTYNFQFGGVAPVRTIVPIPTAVIPDIFLEELADVEDGVASNNDGIYWDSTASLWKYKSIAEVLTYTPANDASVVHLAGTETITGEKTFTGDTTTIASTYFNLDGALGSGTNINIKQYTSSTAMGVGYSSIGAYSNTKLTFLLGNTTAFNGRSFYLDAASLTVNTPRNYILPDASGTIALTSNLSSFITLTSLSATAPLAYNNTTGGFSISQAGVSGNGYLSSTDWNTFNNKQAAGNYITALTGEATASGPGSSSVTLSTSAVTGKILTGINITGGSISATDSILVALGKTQNQINGLLGGAIYQSTWNASTNSPSLTSGTGTKGYYYIVSVAGSTNLDGITDWKVGDWAIFNGTTWDKVDNTDAVSSVNGFTGAVSLTTANISEVTNLYYTEARVSANTNVAANTAARHNAVTLGTANGLSLSTQQLSLALASTTATGALSSTDWNTFNNKQNALTLTTTGTSGAATLVGATLNIPNYAPDLSGYVTLATTQTISGLKTFTSLLTAADFTNGFLTISGGTIDRTTTGTSIELQFAGNGPIRFFGSTAWPILFSSTSGIATFSNSITATSFIKSGGTSSQYLMADGSTSTLTNPVTGTGTTNYLPKFTGTSTIGNSIISESTSTIAINGTKKLFLRTNQSGTGGLLAGSALAAEGNFSIYSDSGVAGEVLGMYYWNGSGYKSSLEVANVSSGNSNLILMKDGGNLGLGVTPSAGGLSGYVLFELANGGASIYSGPNQNLNGSNISWSGGTASYKISNFATLYNQQSGQHQWYNAPSGTAGNAISFTQAMTLTAAGRLLLGTTTESTYLLDVNGTGRFSGALSGTSATFSGNLTIDTNTFFVDSTNNRVGIGLTNPAGLLHIKSLSGNAQMFLQNSAGTETLSITQNTIQTSSATNLILGTDGVARLTIASTGAATFSSSVAVGASTSASDFRYYPVSSASGNSVLVLKDDGADGTLDICSEIIGNANAASSPITFRVSSVAGGRFEAMRIANTGAATFSSRVNTPSYTSGGSYVMQGTSGQTNARFWLLGSDVTSYGDFAILQSGANSDASYTPKLTISPTGNVGIGTTSPSALFHTAKSSSGEVARFSAPNGSIPYILIGRPDSAAEGMKLTYDSNTGDTSFETVASHNMLFKNNNTERMRITSGGVVQIANATGTQGTIQGAERLNINGDIYSYGNIFSGKNGAAFSFAFSGANYAQLFQSLSTSYSLGYGASRTTSGTAVLSWTSDNNVGIGTTNPVTTALLHLSSTTKGFLPPVMTTTQKNAIASPATGLIVFDSTLGKLCVFSTTWQTITSV